ncbi:MAG: hypothetical protein ABSA33_00570 [Candidatus Micrarchaeaceae archaeon]|jgi:hypothetical protein
MDLLERVAVIAVVAVVIIAVIGGAYLLLRHSTSSQLTSAQAVQFVLKDVKISNPGANVTVISVSNSTQEQYSYNIVLSIVYNSTKPCPTLLIEQFDYPAFGLSKSVPNLYTQKCVVYGLSDDTPTYVISSPYIAIAQSYNQSLSHSINQVLYYVSDYGYNNTVVTAKYYPYLNNTQTNLGKSYYNVWLVRYKAPVANYSVYTVLGNSTVLANYTQP